MKPAFRRKGIADMHAVNEESASTFVLAASTMLAFFTRRRKRCISRWQIIYCVRYEEDAQSKLRTKFAVGKLGQAAKSLSSLYEPVKSFL